MKTFEKFYKWDLENGFETWNIKLLLDFKKIFLEYDVENFNRKPFVGIFEEILRESFQKILRESFQKGFLK
jgi:hypothetical protein